MKPLGFRTRLLMAFWGVLLLGLCLPSYLFHRQLQGAIYSDAQERIQKDLEFVGWSLKQHQPFAGERELDRWCTGTGRHLGIRITYILEGGRVIADTEVPFQRIVSMDNHWRRPEVMAARRLGIGVSVRHSATLNRDLMYVARPFSGAAGIRPGILRVAMPLSLLKDKLDQQSRTLWLVLLASLLGTAGLAYGLSQWFNAPLNRLVEAAVSIGRGNYDQRVSMDAIPELVRLARAINEMAAGIARHIGEVAAEKAQLETILESMREGVVVLDGEGRIRKANRSMNEIQKDPPVRRGKRVLEVFLNSELHQACSRVLSGSARVRLELQLEGGRFYDVNVVPMAGERPKGGVVLVFHDITEMKRLVRVRRDFVANVSHELRTPLTAIKGYAETLLDGPCADVQPGGEFIRVIVRKADHMSRMVNDLLLLTRLESEKNGEAMEMIDAHQALIAALESCKLQAVEKEIEIVEALHRKPLLVLAVEDHLEQVFRNLIDNAIRYSDPGTTVSVTSYEQGDDIVFGVRDQGPGISSQHQVRVFERFYRVDKPRETKSGSTGLGLAICRHIVENLGGRIWVVSPPLDQDCGCVFYFTLRAGAERRDEASLPSSGRHR